MSSCKEIDPLIQLFVDGEIEESEQTLLFKHIQTCSSCREQFEEMITLVRGLEEIGYDERQRLRRMVLQPVKWAVVTASIALFILISPQGGEQTKEISMIAQEDSTHHMLKKQMDVEMMVLATNAEKLHIPQDEHIQIVQPKQINQELTSQTALIYPSAMPFFENDQQPWLKKMQKVVLVKVPDVNTFHAFLTTAGLHIDPAVLGRTQFPTSIIIKTGKNPQIETFHFPENEQGISHWFDQLTTH
jgi:hypothetical protein